MNTNTKSMRFDEDLFDPVEHKKAAIAVTREKARKKRVRRQVKFGKIALAVVTIIVFFLLFFIAAQLGLMNFR